MNTVVRALFVLISALILSACVLSSKAPQFAADNGAVPIATDTEFDAFTRDGGEWKKEAEIISFKRDGSVYLMSDGKNLASVLFVGLAPQWFVAQYREGDKPYYYGLVKATGVELEVTSLPCDKLQPLAGSMPELRFSGDDCSLDAVGDPKAFFTSLIDKLPGPGLKLVPRK